ncbi:MAG: RNA polymerase sigma factor [Bacilli bacterium]
MLQITEELVKKLQNKDEEAFQKIYNAYVKLIYHIAYSYTYNKEDAEDIVSEVFMKVMHSIHSYQENGKFKEWISMITRNVSLNFVTRDKNKDTLKDDELIQRKTCNNASNNEMIMMFEEFLDKDTTSIMILRFIYNYKFKDIAIILNMTIGKVQSLYYDGLDKLRKVY